jgi:hypothetical protein
MIRGSESCQGCCLAGECVSGYENGFPPCVVAPAQRATNSDYAAALKAIIDECCDDAYRVCVKSVDDIVAEIQRLNATHFA